MLRNPALLPWLLLASLLFGYLHHYLDTSSVASSQLIVASQTSFASSVVASHLNLDISLVASFELIVVSHLVDKVSLFLYSNCTALYEGVISRSKLVVASINIDDKVLYTHLRDRTALCEGDSLVLDASHCGFDFDCVDGCYKVPQLFLPLPLPLRDLHSLKRTIFWRRIFGVSVC